MLGGVAGSDSDADSSPEQAVKQQSASAEAAQAKMTALPRIRFALDSLLNCELMRADSLLSMVSLILNHRRLPATVVLYSVPIGYGA